MGIGIRAGWVVAALVAVNLGCSGGDGDASSTATSSGSSGGGGSSSGGAASSSGGGASTSSTSSSSGSGAAASSTGGACVNPAAPTASVPLTGAPDAAAQQALVDAHNAIRQSTVLRPAPATALSPVTWNEALAEHAQAWADTCPGAHNMNRNVAPFGVTGENLYFASFVSTAAGVVNAWASEACDYTYATDRCAAGAQCGHYTQLVWAGSTAIGCGVKTGCPGTFSSVVVCNYGPAGNFVGQRPY
jgi:uncharacterized protein YkwD